jgi:hypothetical protein
MSDTKRRMILVLGTIGLSLVWDLAAALLTWGPWAAYAMTALLLCIFGGYMLRTRDPVILRLFLFGTVVGFGELFADAWAVNDSQTLVYLGRGEWPFLWASPLYMPLSWIVVITQLGYISYWIFEKKGLVWSIVAATVMGATNIPVYEWLAAKAGFWTYQDCWIILKYTPVYVIAGEAALTMVLPLVVWRVETVPWKRILFLGVLQSLWVYWVSARLCYAIFG